MPEKNLKFIFFSAWGEMLGVPLQLQRQGAEVIVALVDDMKNVGMKEDPDEKKLRLKNFQGLLDIQKAETLIDRMASFKDKEDYFVFFDFNNLWRFSQEATKQGFTRGLFPTKFDYLLENDRNMGKEFVQKFYPGVKVADVQEFKTVDEGMEYVNESEDFLALKANDPAGSTVVPESKDIGFTRNELSDALNAGKKDYESKGFILEKQIRDGVEFCPEAIYNNGEMVAASIDLENKAIGGENLSFKTGCSMNLVREIPLDASIVPTAFPDGMERLAKKHKGMFFADINLIQKDGEFYFLEFSAARPGFDALVTEIDMSDGAQSYFESIDAGENPFMRSYGAAVRAFNFAQDGEKMKGGLSLNWKPEVNDHIWPFELMRKDGRQTNTGAAKDLFTVTESSDDARYAVEKVYRLMDKISFKEPYYRSMSDFLSSSYDTSILRRNEAIESITQPSAVEEG